jgi:hypothetical protein
MRPPSHAVYNGMCFKSTCEKVGGGGKKEEISLMDYGLTAIELLDTRVLSTTYIHVRDGHDGGGIYTHILREVT